MAALSLTHCFVAGFLLHTSVQAVLRYPDGSFESRVPLHVDECDQFGAAARRECLLQLHVHLLEDADCNRVICDQINSSTPIEFYADAREWMPFKSLCGHLQDLFSQVFGLGIALFDQNVGMEDVKSNVTLLWRGFRESAIFWLEQPMKEDDPNFANSTHSVLLRHFLEVLALSDFTPLATLDDVLQLAVHAARRLQLLIENVSVTLLLNIHLQRLKQEGELTGQDLIADMYGDPELIRVDFHEIPGKRWDTLCFLLEQLGVTTRSIFMAEVGVERANTSQRLLERNPNLSYLGVDPYVNNDALYQSVVERLEPFTTVGRFTLERRTSAEASAMVPEASLDIVFLDARHDFEAVWHDVVAWHRKVKPGGVLCGHDFSWMFPTVAMAVYKAAFSTPDRKIHLTPDGVWWFQL